MGPSRRPFRYSCSWRKPSLRTWALEVYGEGVDDGCSDAVEAAGDLVAATAELAAGVKDGHDGLEGGDAGGGVLADGDAAAVVRAADGAVLMDGYDDLVAVTGHCFVDGVVDDFVDKVVQAALVRTTDVHAGPAADGLEAFEDLDIGGGVAFRLLL